MIEVALFKWVQFFLACTISFYVVKKAIPILIELAYHKDLYDKPDGTRKVHTKFISNLGGIAIFMAFMAGFMFSGKAHLMIGLPYFFGSSLALFFCGLKDDLIGLAPKTKLIIEFIAAISAIYGMHVSISQFGGLFGITDIPIWISSPITLFTMIVVINAYNLIDGIDGLAAGVATIASITFSIGFFYVGDTVFAYMALVLAVTCVGYLLHNFHPASIFMGDTGSLVIGFILSVLAIKFISLNQFSEFYQNFGNSSVIVPIAVLSIPLYDTLRVFTRRIARGESPFKADSDHIHHTLLKMGWGQKRTVIYLYCVTVVITLIAILTALSNVNFGLFSVIFSMVLMLPTMGIKRKLASIIGIDLERILLPNKNVDLYHHLEIENKKHGKSVETPQESLTE
ncbi:MAG: undecaprenyl/decaprenyl-phosphate alpha-N-acetylglucosaminyl 1-phosphate transferase [Balneolaceae bacterium]|nr:undecaprenyl/decaprenyl-phosphate alpha-N-acetylglucosaminyl 1-phosphate transferase [Balneolaceae bacterium]MBO6546928.1 undecaprenyl/decaprenyl-phosphate alpha-N-acetylglucosaminyl 1-phosphate transferase [Balneolaceae bacterium]MBO6649288.1 undecaprenyl/decaprenyl-phosphate alpha-N-acetylglucosaminyl 1-phosphate transferase [Balneolaceae bacterium]